MGLIINRNVAVDLNFVFGFIPNCPGTGLGYEGCYCVSIIYNRLGMPNPIVSVVEPKPVFVDFLSCSFYAFLG